MSKPDRQEFSTSSNYFTTLIIVTNKNERKFIFGLVVVERFVGRVEPQRLLSCYALLTLIAVIGFLSIRSTWIAPFWLFLIGFGASGLHPIAEAEVRTRQPGHS
jgi:fucose permease